MLFRSGFSRWINLDTGRNGIDGTGTGDRPFRSGPVRSGTGLDFGPAGLPFDRSFAVRPVVYRSTGQTGRPVDCRSNSHLPFDRLVITEKCVK